MFPDGVRNAFGALIAPIASFVMTAVGATSIRASEDARGEFVGTVVGGGSCSILVGDFGFHKFVSNRGLK